MPFDRLPSLNLQIPQTHFAPLPARIPNQKGLMIAQALAQFIPEALKQFSPEHKRKREEAEMDYNIKKLQYQMLLANPTGKTDMQAWQLRHLKALTTKAEGENAPSGTFNQQVPDHWKVETPPTTEKPVSIPELPPNPFNTTSSMVNLSPVASFPTTDPDTYWT